jgi:hypothetical protein
MDPHYLSKTDFLNFRLCPSFSWIAKHEPWRVPTDPDPGAARRKANGNLIDRLARQRYPCGRLIASIDIAPALVQTQRLLNEEVSVLFQPVVWSPENYLARADVLIRTGTSWRIVEVKDATSVKPEHVIDAAFQLAAHEAAGMDIQKVSLLHLNKDYRRLGECDVDELFLEADITEKVRALQAEITEQMRSAWERLCDPTPPATCLCNRQPRSGHCPTFTLFHPDIPESGSIYDLQRISPKKTEEAFLRGIVHLKDWPDDLPLTDGQRHQVEVHQSGRARLDRDGLKALLDEYVFPLYFLDYETASLPMPPFDGCWPYQQVPFQYSLHILDGSGDLTHREFLATERNHNPIPDLVAQLRQDIGDHGSVVVWNATFERGRNRELAAAVSAEAPFLENLNDRMVDLMECVSKHHYVHPNFNGSASIKVVLPVAAPELSYADFKVHNGAEASERWLTCMAPDTADSDRSEWFEALRDYCRLDTLAMVRVWEHLHGLCAE